MSAPTTIGAFLEFCAQRNPRFVHPIPERTPYEQMLHDLDNGDPAVLTAFNWARQTQNASADAVLAEWRRYAETERAGVRRFVMVSHTLAIAPAAEALETLRLLLDGAGDDLLALYTRHDGASLFVDREDGGSGLFFFPLAELDGERESLAERLDGPVMETVEDGGLHIYGRPDWLDSAVVFAGFGYAPERLLLCTQGEYRGRVFLFCHDPQELVQCAPICGALFDQLRQQPIALLGTYGGACFQGASAYEADEAGNRD